MRKYKSFLAKHLEEFFHYRWKLGYVNKSLGSQLKVFDSYVLEKAVDFEDITPALFLEFREKIPGSPANVNNIITTVRNFFAYLHRYGHVDHNPVQDLPAKTENAFIPFIFSPKQTEDLLQAILCQMRRTEKHFLIDLGIYTAILLLARCGMRISEPLRLELTQYDPGQGTLFIHKTKFHKDRLIPLPRIVQEDLDNYLSLRSRMRPESAYLLPGFKKNLRDQQIYPVFNKAVQEIGIVAPRKVIGNMVFGRPTPHSLRHSFAVNTLKAGKERGQDPQAVLPVLSAYMGHSKYRYTALYLKVLDAQRRQGFVDFAVSHLEDV
ncbi:MAG: tyrosine-type recombinase/integrase [Desulfovermiculus sp.]|nr:tyrosine-type recombinase/integrase [Desulfovermiculus sp.]